MRSANKLTMEDKDSLQKKDADVRHSAEGRIIELTEIHSSPLPSPADVERYESILPGSFDRILTMAEKQQEHRIATERIAAESRSRAMLMAQPFTLLLVILLLAVSVIFMFNGLYGWAGAIACITVVVVVSIVIESIFSKRRRDK